MRRSSKNLIPSACLGLGLAASAGSAFAQITPGQVGDTLKRQNELQPARPAPTLQDQRPEESRPADAGQKRIVVQRFEFAGNTLYTGPQLAALVASYTNRPLSLLDLYAAADLVAGHYVENGYSLVSVNVPPQKIDGGVVRLLVSEGRLASIASEGGTSYTTEQLARYLPG
ncbi:MAG TPA: POTRA domain-containing protein, partial [Solimonas sp.]|nr:POTRA domain-containing protein [Solimonas sp.]